MELWLDTCDLDAIAAANKFGVMYGVTTNPSILAKANQDPETIVAKLLEVQDGPITVQVTNEDASGIIQQAKEFYMRSDRIIVKVPATQQGLIAIRQLSQDGIDTMATALFHPNQALLAALAGAHYVAPYLGRMRDAGIDAYATLRSMMTIYKQYAFSTKILVAALRTLEQITVCAEIGVHAITLKLDVFAQLMQEHPLTMEAIDIFARDAQDTKERFSSILRSY
jgi:TalC/MipB family fructose-6-phosphate aldolase